MLVFGYFGGGDGFCDAFGDSVEWSFACPGRGMAFACWDLLTSDLTTDAVLGVSLAGPPAGTSKTLARGSFTAAAPTGAFAFGADTTPSEQPADTSTANVAANAMAYCAFLFVISSSNQANCGTWEVILGPGRTAHGAGIAGTADTGCVGCWAP